MSTALSVLPSASNQNNVVQSFNDDFFAEMKQVDDEIARFAFGLFQERGSLPGFDVNDWLKAESSLLIPISVSIEDEGNHLNIKADVTGFSEKDLKVHVGGDTLRICGKTEQTRTTGKGTDTESTESSTRKIRTVVTLPAKVDGKKPSFKVKSGILMLSLPKIKAQLTGHASAA